MMSRQQPKTESKVPVQDKCGLTRHTTLKIVLKCTYFMALIDCVFCLDAYVINKRETLSVVTLEWSEIISTYNTPDTILRDGGPGD